MSGNRKLYQSQLLEPRTYPTKPAARWPVVVFTLVSVLVPSVWLVWGAR